MAECGASRLHTSRQRSSRDCCSAGRANRNVQITSEAITIQLNTPMLAKHLGVDHGIDQQPVELAIPVTLKRSGPAMRLVLPNGQSAIAQTDDTLITAIAKAHAWWAELLANPEWRLDDLAAKHGLNPSWATRTIRLAFLDPSIVEKICAGTARATLSFERCGTLKACQRCGQSSAPCISPDP